MSASRLWIIRAAPLFLLIAGAGASAQPAKPKPAATRPAIVRRVGTAAEIDSLGRVAKAVLQTGWAGGYQGVSSVAGCELTLLSRKTTGSLVQDDLQTVDVGLLEATSEDRDDVLAETSEARFGIPGERALVLRSRKLTLDGAPQPPRSERVVFFTLTVGRGDPRNQMLNMKEALLRYSIACERRTP